VLNPRPRDARRPAIARSVVDRLSLEETDRAVFTAVGFHALKAVGTGVGKQSPRKAEARSDVQAECIVKDGRRRIEPRSVSSGPT
jgi:hypothetical protein